MNRPLLLGLLLGLHGGTVLSQPATETKPSEPNRTLQGSTEQAADAPGWNGALPPPATPDEPGDIGDISIFNFYLAPRLYPGYADHRRDCRGVSDWRRLQAERRKGYIQGGTFGSAPRCEDRYPELPLRHWPDGDAYWSGDGPRRPYPQPELPRR